MTSHELPAKVCMATLGVAAVSGATSSKHLRARRQRLGEPVSDGPARLCVRV
jgi:hypothetical protein